MPHPPDSRTACRAVALPVEDVDSDPAAGTKKSFVINSKAERLD